MKYNLLLNTVFIMIILTTSCHHKKEAVDFIVMNANVYTIDSLFSTQQAFAVKDGHFAGIGGNETIQNDFISDRIIDLNGLPVYPGFNDGHCHFYGYGENLVRYAELSGTKSFEEVIERLKSHLTLFPSDWILGRGWDQNDWENQSFPDNSMLEEAFPGKKILLIRIDGHASLVSKSLLEAAGIDKSTRIKGGEVIVDKAGELTGMLIDNADMPAKALVPSLSREEKIKALLMAQQNCFEVGLSSVTDAGLTAEMIDLIDELHTSGSLKMKLNVMLNPDSVSLDRFMNAGPLVKERLTVRSVKLYADGALGSRGAKLIEPYSDDPGQKGMIMYERSYYEEICARSLKSGFAVNTHAIGDSANRFVLNLYATFLEDTNDLRWRIEHAQLVHPEDFNLFGQFSIIPSIQSTHATSDMYWAEARLGKERLKSAYAQQELLNQNGWLVNGTDFPIEHISPLYTFYAAVSRKDLSGYPENGFQPENALNREDALRSITIWPAKGAFEESFKGSLEVGKQADFVVLGQDIMTIRESEIPDTKVRMLFVQGEKVLGD